MVRDSESDGLNARAESPLQIGIIGCSLARARYGAAVTFSSRLHIAALVDPDARFIRAWSKELGTNPALHADLTSLLQSETIPEALLVEVPLAERAQTILQAIPHCRALLCVPPYAATLEETDRILHAAGVHGTLLVPVFPRRCDPVFHQAIQLAATGEIGLLQQVRCDWSFQPSRVYGVEIGADPDAGTWNSLLPYVGIHATDICRWYFGDVLTVSADIDSAQKLTTLPARQRDAAPLLAIFLLGQEQGPATCHFSRSRAVVPAERYTLTGSLGHLELVVSSATQDPEDFPSLTLHRPGQRAHVIPLPDFPDSDLPAPFYRAVQMFRQFAAAAQSGLTPPEGEDPTRAALEAVHAAYFSAQEGRKVTLPLRRSPRLPEV